jgi:dTDP-4-dehydrorhamnose reductase
LTKIPSKILVFGGRGMLGHKLVQVIGANLEVWTTIKGEFSEIEHFGLFSQKRTIEHVDVTDVESLQRAVETAKPDVVINAVGLVKQLVKEHDAVTTLLINSVFPQQLARLADEFGFRLITISTDCVFSGEKGNYTESDIPDAHDLYGISKLLGEVKQTNCLTIRTSMIGRELAGSYGLVEWFLSNCGKNVKGYVNAVYSGFPTIILADIISNIITDHPELQGVYHISSDPISKFHLLELLNKYYQADVRIEPFEDFVIDRRLDSSAFRKRTGFSPLGWEEMIEKMATDPTPYEAWRK